MFNVGDLIIYSLHGICHIDDICEMKYQGVSKKYYVLHPLEDKKLRISIPVNSDKVTMLELLNKEEAEEVIKSFALSDVSEIELNNNGKQVYSGIVKAGNRKPIYRIANSLMRKKIKIENEGKKFSQSDSKLLSYIQNILFEELAIALNTTSEKINEKVTEVISESMD